MLNQGIESNGGGSSKSITSGKTRSMFYIPRVSSRVDKYLMSESNVKLTAVLDPQTIMLM